MSNTVTKNQAIEELIIKAKEIFGDNLNVNVAFNNTGEEYIKETEQHIKTPRPFDTAGRLNGIRGIAKWLGVFPGFVQKRVHTLPTYNIGRKIYAYEDDVMGVLANDYDHSAVICRIFQSKGYKVKRKSFLITPEGRELEICEHEIL